MKNSTVASSRPARLGALIWLVGMGLHLEGNQSKAPDPWPAVSPEELALKDDPSNPGAKALILERTVTTDDTKSIEWQYYRIKILTEAGKKYADIEIPYVDKVPRIEEIKARIVQPDGRAVDRAQGLKANQNVEDVLKRGQRKASLRLDREGNLQGNLKVTFSGQEALQRRLDNRDQDEVGRRKALEEEVQAWLPAGSNVELKSVSQWEQAANTLTADFSTQLRNLATAVGRRLLLPIGIFQVTNTHPFQNARRIHPIYFSYPYQVIDGQKVETLPAPISGLTTTLR